MKHNMNQMRMEADKSGFFVIKNLQTKPIVAAKEGTMGIKRKKTDFTIEPSPLIRISAEVVDPNEKNLQAAGLWDFICNVWPLADPDKVLAFLLGSCRGAQEEFRVQGQVVHFDIETIAEKFSLPTSGPTLLSVEALSRQELLQIFEKHAESQVEGGYSIAKAKPC